MRTTTDGVGQHPAATSLIAYAQGKLSAEAADPIGRHLEQCDQCRAVVEKAPADSLMDKLRRDDPAATASLKDSTLGPAPAVAVEPGDLPVELRDHPRYQIQKLLGAGGMGAVYLARHKLMDRLLAIKVIRRNLLANADSQARFQQEVKAAAKLQHANIVQAYDSESAGDLQLLAMEYVEGASLAHCLKKNGPLPILHACTYAMQIARGLQHAHEKGMVHRDIKPQNLMLTRQGRVKILDFGLAKVHSENQTTGAGLTEAGAMMGTPLYIAPEQAKSSKDADIRADIYSLGCTLFHFLTGRPPFVPAPGETSFSVAMRHIQDAPPPLESLRPDAPPELCALVARMLAKDPAARPQTPQEVIDALAPLQKAVANVPSAATPVPGADGELDADTPTAAAPTPRRRLLAIGVAAGLLVGFIALGIIYLKTADGVVELDVPEGCEVVINDELIAIKQPDGKPLQIKLDGQKKTLKVIRDDVEIESRELTLEDRGKTIRVGWNRPREVTAEPQKIQSPDGIDPLGKPSTWVGGKPIRCTFWVDSAGWHFRCTNHPAGARTHSFKGIITTDGGRFLFATQRFHLPSMNGTVKLDEEKKTLSFGVNLKKNPQRDGGFDFNVAPDTRRIHIAITIDDNESPTQIFIGRQGVNPSEASFWLSVPPPGAADAGADPFATFNFIGTWRCNHPRTNWTGTRRVVSDTEVVDDSGRRFKWERKGGIIYIYFERGTEKLMISADDPNYLSGHNTGDVVVHWRRQ